ncbi:large conductance mechanosensitive channel [Microbacteriaceae bacterium SG_E_30_P1]|uniref:Large-conductance mechanosensitive channel n=1 Tax=Antiquaquibacter oligotrophicus TaxID=2880260 RepID=A0ABT6KKE5_9MICO|nr:large conductance mechanosensitive channel protein MscL [Antiquaquibacter oligotrophicus]MDH6180191.1 large conductance mechanosensitive channel [Antiquaquibacter oligotrophicus]UDF14060.1 large conductance mechanosensitive channel protein MscL [Antiquaquibacter oligotrophicus]
MLKGFKEFILRGNVIDLAVAVVIGAAFTGIVNAIVNSVFNPAIGALFDAESLATALPVVLPTTSGGEAVLYFGAVIAAIIQFLLVAVVVYFALIVPINYIKRRAFAKKDEKPSEDAPPPTELELLAEIRDLLAADKGANADTVAASETHGKHAE